MMHNIKQRRVFLPIFASLALVFGCVPFAPHTAFSQTANNTGGSGSSMITEEQAIQAAITNQSIQRSDVEAVELDDEDGRPVFSVEIVRNNQDFDVKVDRQTGEAINVEPDFS
jgi:uncharacterized membrane protein YkoI